MTTSLLELEHVTKRFFHGDADHIAVDDVTLALEEGQALSIIGPSGCGKTTLLRLIAGFDVPSDGAIRFAGKPVAGPSAERTVVFQEYALFPWMTVQNNIRFGLKAKGVSPGDMDRIIEEALQLVHLESSARLYPAKLSGGMRQRVAIARALAIETRLLLMDEPFGALDLLTREALQSEFLGLRQRKPFTQVLITHSVDEAILLADRVAIMSPSPGRIKECVEVGLPWPRSMPLRLDPSFLEIKAHVESVLMT